MGAQIRGWETAWRAGCQGLGLMGGLSCEVAADHCQAVEHGCRAPLFSCAGFLAFCLYPTVVLGKPRALVSESALVHTPWRQVRHRRGASTGAAGAWRDRRHPLCSHPECSPASVGEWGVCVDGFPGGAGDLSGGPRRPLVTSRVPAAASAPIFQPLPPQQGLLSRLAHSCPWSGPPWWLLGCGDS